ncbi:MAG: hypothetical protein HYU77_13660 [Betaproteobacteria bacterium]|nr:hypothetical protein [Betaproteobacteria bacterium]
MDRHEHLKSQAVVLATAFVTNGDVRIGNNVNADSDSMLLLSDLIDSLYVMLQVTYRRMDERNQG